MTQPTHSPDNSAPEPPFPGSAYPFVVQRAGAAGKELYDECLKELKATGWGQAAAEFHVMASWDILWRALQGGKTDDELAEEMGQGADLEDERPEDTEA